MSFSTKNTILRELSYKKQKLEDSFATPIIKNIHALWPSNSIPGNYPKEMNSE